MKLKRATTLVIHREFVCSENFLIEILFVYADFLKI